MCFLDRQIVLRVLSEHIIDQTKLVLNKKISKVDHSRDGVTVHCEDGCSYEGDIIVGADGVFSKVRQEMWRAAGCLEPDEISVEEKNCRFRVSVLAYGAL